MVLFVLAAVAVFALVPASAAADGLPAVGIDARALSVPGGEVAYTTKSGRHSTLLTERARYGGVLRERRIAGSFSLPAVAYDGSPAGLSADGRTLVLISPRTRYPRRRTTFAIVDPGSLRVRRQIALKGDFSFDAISPDGRLMYLVEYNPHNYGEYDVRAYDIQARRLFAEPVVDPREPDEDMNGVPVTRVSSPDGRWAYTLYEGQEHPFVHALDTSERTAVCIDLDDLATVWRSSLELRDGRLEVVGPAGRTRASIDTRTHRLVEKHQSSAEDAGTSWVLIAAPTAAVLLVAAVGRRRFAAIRTAAH